MNTVNLFDLPVAVATMSDVLGMVEESVSTRSSLDIGVVNAAKVINIRKDIELAEAVRSSDAIFADGMSVVWASRVLGKPLPERIAGIDLMHRIMELGDKKEFRVFCLGATQEVLNKVCESFSEDYPRATIVGARNGYFSEDEEKRVAEEIRDARADVLFVAITSPKKERFMARWSDLVDVPVVHGVGGSFDVVAGEVKRAPEAWQRSGFEWLYRVLQEPGRLWKRYLITNTLFMALVFREAIRNRVGAA